MIDKGVWRETKRIKIMDKSFLVDSKWVFKKKNMENSGNVY